MSLVIDISRFIHQNFHFLWCLAIFLGTWTVLAEVYRFVHFLYAKLIRKRKNLQQRYGKGTWALITGSSQGIGKGFAIALAKQNFNIILTARTQSKLIETQKQILQKYPSIQVRSLVIDFVKTCDLDKIMSSWYKEQKLQDLDISIVINNAGIDYLNKLNDVPLKQLIRLIDLDCFFVNSMQYLFLDRWIVRKSQETKQHKRLIINVASLCAELPVSYFSAYNAAKIYADRLTQACALEYPQVDFMSLRPSQVYTRMTAFKKDIFTIYPHQCVEALLDDVGYQTCSNGHVLHALQSWIYTTVPLWFFNLLWEGIFVHQFKQARKIAQQKK